MAFEPQFAAEEQVAADIRCVIIASRQQSRQVELRLVLTDQAAYWPGHKFGLVDSVSTERMPIGEVVSVSLRKEFFLGPLTVGGALFFSGAIMAILLKTTSIAGEFKNHHASGIAACFVLMVFGLCRAAFGGWHRTLVIASERGEFRWAEPHSFGGTIKDQVTLAFRQVHDWARSNGLRLELDSES